MPAHSWVGDPDYRVSSDPTTDEGLGERKRHGATRRAVMRELVAAGAKPRENRSGDSWDIENLPLGGRVKVSGAVSRNRRLLVLAWLRQHAERRHWGAVCWLNWGAQTAGRANMTVQMQLEDWAQVIGRLARLERERERWLNGAPHHHDGSDRGR